ncbi:hypothetical protein JCM30394_09460 [Deferrisoma palaeochoriense]
MPPKTRATTPCQLEAPVGREARPVRRNKNFRLGHTVNRGRLDHGTEDRETGNRGLKLLGSSPTPLWGPTVHDSNARDVAQG